MSMKVTEFMKLAQGTRLVWEYLHAFNNLSRYAPEFMNTDAKKIASFKRGLNTKMTKSMGLPQEPCSMTLSVIAWLRKTTTCMLRLRTARGPLNQVHHNRELKCKGALSIVRQYQGLGSGHLRGGNKLTSHSNKNFRSLSRLPCLRIRLVREARLVPGLLFLDRATTAISLGTLLSIVPIPRRSRLCIKAVCTTPWLKRFQKESP
jgi:hypothetical protein